MTAKAYQQVGMRENLQLKSELYKHGSHPGGSPSRVVILDLNERIAQAKRTGGANAELAQQAQYKRAIAIRASKNFENDQFYCCIFG